MTPAVLDQVERALAHAEQLALVASDWNLDEPENEPVFLIRGQDLAAPAALRAYAMEAHRCGADMDLIEATLRQAREMEARQRERARKTPDMPRLRAQSN